MKRLDTHLLLNYMGSWTRHLDSEEFLRGVKEEHSSRMHIRLGLHLHGVVNETLPHTIGRYVHEMMHRNERS